MRVDVKLMESNSQVRQLILSELARQLRETFVLARPGIINRTKDMVRDALKQEPEYQSLVSGKLRAELGIADSANIDIIVDALVNTLDLITTSVTFNNTGLKGGFVLQMIQSDNISGIIGMDEATVTDNQGQKLPWLEWLLLRGNQIIIRNYQVRMGASPYSRTNMAVMVQSKKNWRVPMEFAGTITNNWTTRALDKVDAQIIDNIINSIEATI